MKSKFKNHFSLSILYFLMLFFFFDGLRLRGDETKTYSIKMAGTDAGFCKLRIARKEKGLFLIEGETYFELSKKEGKIKHFREKLILSSDFTPVDYYLEVLSHPKPIKSVEAKVKGQVIYLTYTFQSGDKLIKDERKVDIPPGNLAILDADVIEHFIILFKKYNLQKKEKQEIVNFNAQYGNAGKVQLVYKGREKIKISNKEYICSHISMEIEGKSFF